MKLEPEIKAKN